MKPQTTSPNRSIALAAALFAGCAVFSIQAADGDAPAVPDNAKVINFDDDTVGTPPNDLLAGRAGSGGPADWKIVSAGDAPSGKTALGQLSAKKNASRYPHVVHGAIIAADVDISVKFKTVTGDLEQAAGIIFRYKDSKNYYLVRADALDNNVVAFKTQLGRPSNIGVKGNKTAFGVDTRVPPRRWHTLRVIARGPLIEVYLDGKKQFEVEDETFTAAGRVGIWTKSDSVVHFDDFTVAEL